MIAPLRWLVGNAKVYLDNASSRRDFRAQLRTSRSAYLWAFYLAALIGVAWINYALSAARGSVSIVEAQAKLQEFYQVVMVLLATMVAVVAPALGAVTVVAERERRSLDLVFSAPVKPKAFLVGKLMSAYRYVWIMLVLALPVTAVSVVLGGATWADVLVAYVLLSLQALLLSAVALLVSTLSRKAVAAVIWSYMLVAAYLINASASVGAAFFGGFGSATAGQAPFFVALSPFFVVQAAPTFTELFGYRVPNWVLAGGFILLMVRLCLLGAGSALSPAGAPETKNLRISGLLYVFGLSLLAGFLVSRAFAGSVESAAATVLGWAPVYTLVFSPLLCCYGLDGERKFRPDGAFSIRAAFRGTPAGSLPYLLMLLLSLAAGLVLALVIWGKARLGTTFVSTFVWALGFWTLVWALGRFASSLNQELRSARILHLSLLMVLLALPVPFFSLIDAGASGGVWRIHPMHYIIDFDVSRDAGRLVLGAAMGLIGVILGRMSEDQLRRRLAITGVPA